MKGIFFIWELREKNSSMFTCFPVEIAEICLMGEYSYLWRELEHGSANNQRCRVVLGCQGKSVRPVDGSQATIRQNCLRPNDDLQRDSTVQRLACSDTTIFKNPLWASIYLINTRHYCKNSSVCDHCCFDASF